VSVLVRPETPADAGAIGEINRAAFGVSVEADLVDRLRADGDLLVSLLAEDGGRIVGHCGFSRLTVHNMGQVARAVSLGPVAVLPDKQRSGIGQLMIRDGIARLKRAHETLIFVFGDPDYYSRFGFDAGAATAFRTPYDGPYLQVLRLDDDAPTAGEVRYAPAFAGL
jgi:putative acetyltransferase